VAEGPRWLDDEEMAAWRAYLLATTLVEDALDRQLNRDAGMPLAYFEILTRLAEAGDDGLRMNELARPLRYSPSRITHAVTSLERSGWVERRACPTDRRGQIAVLTPEGRVVQAEAAVGHVGEVRARLFDQLTGEQVRHLGEVCRTIVDGFDGRCPGDDG
jgi:DNA-binding MarR family transcriptional regulator